MSRIGLILACEHYPAVSRVASQMDAQLRLWLETLGIRVDHVEVFAAYEGVLPRHGANCDVWIVSGVPLPIAGPSADHVGSLHRFLRAAAVSGRTILAVHHGEHAVHGALAAIDAEPPSTSPHIRSIRNPFRSFHAKDALHRFDPATRQVVSLERPKNLCPRRMFGIFRQAA